MTLSMHCGALLKHNFIIVEVTNCGFIRFHTLLTDSENAGVTVLRHLFQVSFETIKVNCCKLDIS